MNAPAPDTYEHLKDAMFRDYRVPPDRSDQFLDLQSRAEAIFRRHASRWSLWRMKAPGEQWREFGPEFREDADVRAAAKEFDEYPGLLQRLLSFEAEEEQGGMWAFLGVAQPGDDPNTAREMVEQGTGIVWEVLVEIGTTPEERGLPEIDRSEMTEAMRLAHSLAAAMEPRLSKVLPREISVRAVQEELRVEDENGWGSQVSLVDLTPVEAAREVLGAIQEDATEALAVPWPHDPKQGFEFHEPDAEIRDAALHWFYGHREAPVLVLDPIPSEELSI